MAVLFVKRASNCTKILYFESVSKYFCMARFLLVTSLIGFLPSHLDLSIGFTILNNTACLPVLRLTPPGIFPCWDCLDFFHSSPIAFFAPGILRSTSFGTKILLSSSPFLCHPRTNQNRPCFRCTNESAFPIWYFFPSKFQQNFLEVSFPQEASKWMTIQISFNKNHWVFDVGPRF